MLKFCDVLAGSSTLCIRPTACLCPRVLRSKTPRVFVEQIVFKYLKVNVIVLPLIHYSEFNALSGLKHLSTQQHVCFSNIPPI